MILRTDVSESSQLPEIACVSCGEFVSVCLGGDGASVAWHHDRGSYSYAAPSRVGAFEVHLVQGVEEWRAYQILTCWVEMVGAPGAPYLFFAFFATNARNGFDRFPWSVVLLLSKSWRLKVSCIPKPSDQDLFPVFKLDYWREKNTYFWGWMEQHCSGRLLIFCFEHDYATIQKDRR